MEIFSSYTGADFLAFYAVMLITCVFLGLWIPANLRPTGRRNSVEGTEEAAMLIGGTARHSAAVVTELYTAGGLQPSGNKKLAVANYRIEVAGAHRAALAHGGDFHVSDVRKTLAAHAKRVEAQLVRKGLLIAPEDRWQLRALSVLPYVALLAIGLYRQQAGAALGEPTGFLVALMVLTAIAALIRLLRFNPRTMEGNVTARRLEEEGSRLQRAPAAGEADYAVAILGTGVLVGTPWEPVHAARQPASGGDGGGSSSDGGDGGGCGGGCGGCGG